MTKNIGRNDPCPCGSGIKLKKCCLQKGRDLLEDFELGQRLKRQLEQERKERENERRTRDTTWANDT